MARNYKQKDIKLLWGKAANICSFDGCDVVLLDETKDRKKDVIIGEQAHIVAHKDDGPRADSNYPKDKLEDYENLILLCPSCHTKIDKNPEKYPVNMLHEMKRKHEEWVASRVISSVTSVTFAELEVLVKGIVGKNSDTEGGSDLALIKPTEKMDKNSFSDLTKEHIKYGLIKSAEVGEYLNSMATLDPDFGERLKAVVTERYNELKGQNVDPNIIFDELRVFCSLGKGEFLYQAAGLSVVVYFFQSCEIFEK